MQNFTRDITLAVSKIDRRTVQIIMIVLSLTAFVLGAGAPETDCGVGMR